MDSDQKFYYCLKIIAILSVATLIMLGLIDVYTGANSRYSKYGNDASWGNFFELFKGMLFFTVPAILALLFALLVDNLEKFCQIPRFLIFTTKLMNLFVYISIFTYSAVVILITSRL